MSECRYCEATAVYEVGAPMRTERVCGRHVAGSLRDLLEGTDPGDDTWWCVVSLVTVADAARRR